MKIIKSKKRNIAYLVVTMTLMVSISFLTMQVCFAEKSASEKFQDAMKYAGSLRDTVKSDGKKIKVGKFEFKPEEVFKDQKGGYTDNPAQVGYVVNADAMEKSAAGELTKDTEYKDLNGNPVAAPGKAIFNGFQTRPVYKITKGDEYIIKSNAVIANSNNIVQGNSNDVINCENDSQDQYDCKSTYTTKTCNEEIRTIKRICEVKPKVEVVTKEIVCPNCRKIDIRTGYPNSCQGGYDSLFYTDMIHGPTWDDVFVCSKPVSIGETNECCIGFFVQGRNANSVYEMGRAVIPKGMKGYVHFMHTYNACMPGNIYNESRNEVYQSGCFSGGQRIELPVSDEGEQIFRFDLVNKGNVFRINVGVVVFYVQHVKYVKEAQIEMEENCRDI